MGWSRRAIVSLGVAVWASAAHADAPVKIAGLPDGPINLTVEAGGGALARTFRLIPYGVDTVTVTAVRLAGCTDGANQTCDAKVVTGDCREGCTLTAITPHEVQISVATLTAGTYRASLEIVHGASLIAIPVVVTRPVQAALVVTGASGVDRDLPVFGAGAAIVPMRLQDEAARARTIDRVVATPLVRKGGAANVASTGIVTLYRRDGAARSQVDKELTLPPEGTVLEIEVSNLEDAGTYEGKVRLAAAGETVQEITYTVTVRDGVGLAMLLIALGALFSYGIKMWVGKGRARLVQQRNLERLRERLVGLDAAGDRDRALVDALLRELGERIADLQYGGSLKDEAIAMLGRRVDLAAAAIRTGQEVERLPIAARVTARQQLDGHVQTLLDPAVDEARLKVVQAALISLASESAKRAALTDLLTAVEAAVNQARGAVELALQERIAKEVDPPLAAARAAADRNQLTDLAAHLATARLALVRIQADALKKYLPATTPLAFAATPAAWTALRDEVTGKLDAVRQATDADDAARLYEAALARLASALATAIAGWARAEAAKQPEAVADALRKRATEADGTRARPPADALVALDELAREVEELVAGPKGIQFGNGQKRPALPPPLAAIPSLVSRAPRIGGMRQIGHLIAAGDLVVLLVVTLLAVASGVKLLWAGDATWGGWDDWITALLWGAGLHAAGNNPFKSLLGLDKEPGQAA